MKHRQAGWLWLVACLVCVACTEVHGDFVMYKIPGTRVTFALQGKVQVNPGGTVTFTHPALSQQLYFSLKTVEIKRVQTTQQEFNRKVTSAGKDANAVYQAAVWALKKGLLKDFYSGVKKTLELNPKHEAALNIEKLKAQMDVPLPESTEQEQELRKIVKSKDMRIATSNHFILLHDTPEKKAEGRKKNRAQERLALLEKVYESFLLLFHAQEVDLDIPRERMKVVLFNDHKDYLAFATGLSPSLSSASGFWEPLRNVSVFYDHASDSQFTSLQKLQKEIKQMADIAKKNRTGAEGIRFSNTLKLLIDVIQENADIEVVSHEATHQMAGNTGLFPRHVRIPAWVHEGLATYFEAPGDATWSGIGAVNEQRLEWYRMLERDREHSNIDFIVGDQIFEFAASHGSKLHGYGQAWALTHFLLENHLKEFVSYYRILGEMPPDIIMSPELLTELFDKVFGSDRKELDQDWRAYMRSLKTDMEKLEANELKKK